MKRRELLAQAGAALLAPMVTPMVAMGGELEEVAWENRINPSWCAVTFGGGHETGIVTEVFDRSPLTTVGANWTKQIDCRVLNIAP